MPERLNRDFYHRDVVTVARALLGQRLVRVLDRHRLAGLIVEVEAYLGILDRAAHTYNGRRTTRNASMWGEEGHAYVYFTYGKHYCMNVVTGPERQPTAVLLRALEPIEGLDLMHRLRAKAARDTDLCSGPAKLCQAMAIDRTLDGSDLVTGHDLFIEAVRKRTYRSSEIHAGERIGVGYAGEWATKPLRYYLKRNAHVSRT